MLDVKLSVLLVMKLLGVKLRVLSVMKATKCIRDGNTQVFHIKEVKKNV